MVSWEKPAECSSYSPGMAGNTNFLRIDCFLAAEIYTKLEKQLDQGTAQEVLALVFTNV